MLMTHHSIERRVVCDAAAMVEREGMGVVNIAAERRAEEPDGGHIENEHTAKRRAAGARVQVGARARKVHLARKVEEWIAGSEIVRATKENGEHTSNLKQSFSAGYSTRRAQFLELQTWPDCPPFFIVTKTRITARRLTAAFCGAHRTD
jgi:hypothetical protein